jgi:hypothetical protein
LGSSREVAKIVQFFEEGKAPQAFLENKKKIIAMKDTA